MRLLITRITALNARLIAHLETERSVSTCCGSTSKSSEEWAPEHVNASSIHVGRVVAYPDRTAFLGDYFRIGGNPDSRAFLVGSVSERIGDLLPIDIRRVLMVCDEA